MSSAAMGRVFQLLELCSAGNDLPFRTVWRVVLAQVIRQNRRGNSDIAVF